MTGTSDQCSVTHDPCSSEVNLVDFWGSWMIQILFHLFIKQDRELNWIAEREHFTRL